MNWFFNIREAWSAILANKLRSLLTTLGIVVGVAAVVVMIAIGSGTQQRIREEIDKLGPNTLTINPGVSVVGGVRLGSATGSLLSEDDASFIARNVMHIRVAAVVRGRAHLVRGAANWSALVYGIDKEFLPVKDWGVGNERTFGSDEIEAGHKVALLGLTVASKLFSDEDPIGRDVRINHLTFRVIGVLEPKGQLLDGYDLDDVVLLPLRVTRNHLLGRQAGRSRSLTTILAKVDPEVDQQFVKEEIRNVLEQRRTKAHGTTSSFRVEDVADTVKLQEASSSALTILLASVASISLLIGGIGIMNIMLVSVVERTREIGVRAAIGAAPRDIMTQFLAEAVVISMIGASIGVAVGVACAIVADSIFGVRTQITVEPVLLASLFAVGVGVCFGFFPALRASRKSPIDALRYD
jgi:putative ABC transport system permease protein